MNRLLVVALVVLAALAAGDALRGGERTSAPGPAAVEAAADRELDVVDTGAPTFVPPRPTGLRGVGSFLAKKVMRGGTEVLSAVAVADAFPSFEEGPTEIVHLAVAPDGTLVLAVRRFPVGRPLLGALQLWRGSRLVATWAVPPRAFAGGLGFLRPGGLIALFAQDGGLAAVYDRRGNEVSLRS